MKKKYRGKIIKFYYGGFEKIEWQRDFRTLFFAKIVTKLNATCFDMFLIDAIYGVEWIVEEIETGKRMNK